MKRVFSFVFVLVLTFPCSESVRADVLEKEFRSSDGKKSATGYIYQHERSGSRTTSRSRSSRDPVIPAGGVVAQVAPISQFTSDTPSPRATESKPRFGYGSDYRTRTESYEPQGTPPASQPDRGAKAAPVPRSDYPDTGIPSVPSYSDPNPQPAPRIEESPVPDPQPRYTPEPSDRESAPYFEEEESLAGQLLRSLPLLFGQREVEAGSLRPWSPPAIEFDIRPPVHREFHPVVPPVIDPHCAPVISTPFGHGVMTPFGNHVPSPFRHGGISPLGHTPHFGTSLPNPFCLPFGH